MIRLTGKHPFNSEAPLSELFNKGFLTPQNLFYVRSHVTLQGSHKSRRTTGSLRSTVL